MHISPFKKLELWIYSKKICVQVSVCSTNHSLGDGEHIYNNNINEHKMSTVHHQNQSVQPQQQHMQQRLPRHQTNAPNAQYQSLTTMQPPTHQVLLTSFETMTLVVLYFYRCIAFCSLSERYNILLGVSITKS